MINLSYENKAFTIFSTILRKKSQINQESILSNFDVVVIIVIVVFFNVTIVVA